eukprot:5535615-Prymnesium_polylepis.1
MSSLRVLKSSHHGGATPSESGSRCALGSLICSTRAAIQMAAQQMTSGANLMQTLLRAQRRRQTSGELRAGWRPQGRECGSI